MLTMLYHILFLVFTIYVMIEAISYAISEIKTEKNTFGGVFVISFALFCSIFSNIVVWLN